MEWLAFFMDHSWITITFLILCLLFFNFGSLLCLIIFGAIVYFIGIWLLEDT